MRRDIEFRKESATSLQNSSENLLRARVKQSVFAKLHNRNEHAGFDLLPTDARLATAPSSYCRSAT
eukprot:5337877-Pyramimonas_sp.AAC.3